MARRIVASRDGRRANAGAEGINRRHNLQLIGDLDVPSGFAKNGGAHVDYLVILTFPFIAFWLVGVWDSFIPSGVNLLAILLAELFYQVKDPFVVVEK